MSEDLPRSFDDFDARDMVEELCREAIREWYRRTWYGKIWYPVWFLVSALMWCAVLLILAAVNLNNTLDNAASASGNVLPDKYRDER